jgi:hypothetical protein
MKCVGLLLAYAPKSRRAGALISKNGFESITNFPFSEDTFNALMMVLLEDVPTESAAVRPCSVLSPSVSLLLWGV